MDIHQLRVKLQKHPVLQQEFMIRKLGLNPFDPDERAKALNIFIEKGLIDEETMSAWPQICLMAKNIQTSEFSACLVRDPTKHQFHHLPKHDVGLPLFDAHSVHHQEHLDGEHVHEDVTTVHPVVHHEHASTSAHPVAHHEQVTAVHQMIHNEDDGTSVMHPVVHGMPHERDSEVVSFHLNEDVHPHLKLNESPHYLQ